MKFTDYISSPFLAYSFEAGETVRVFKRGSRRFFLILFFFVVFDFSKMVLNATLNDNRVRFYISDFVCTWSKYQALFNYSATVCYVFLIRSIVYLFQNDNDESSKKFSYLNFLRISTEKELVKRHLFSRKAAKQYLFLVDLLIKITKLNAPLYFGGLFLGLSRVLYVAYHSIPIWWLLFCTLPNAISYITLIMFGFRLLTSFYLIFWLNSLFTTAKLRSLSSSNVTLSRSQRMTSKKLELVSRNLSHLDGIIQNFKISQQDFDYTVCAYNSGMLVVLFSFPYLLFFQTDDWLSKVFCSCLYTQSMLLAVYAIVAANIILVNGFLAYRQSVFRLVPKCSNLTAKIKVENFLNVHQKDSLLSYRFLDIFYYNHSFMLKYILESACLVILIYQFNYQR